MSFTYLNELPTPEQIKQEFPLSDDLKAVKSARDAEISAVLKGESDKFLVIIVPALLTMKHLSWTTSIGWQESMNRPEIN